MARYRAPAHVDLDRSLCSRPATRRDNEPLATGVPSVESAHGRQTPSMEKTTIPQPLDADPLASGELRLLDAYWRAANYLSVGQIYLLDNPLLREPLRPSTSSRGCSVTGAPRPA